MIFPHPHALSVVAATTIVLMNVAIADNRKQAQSNLSAQPTDISTSLVLGETGDAQESDDGLTIAIVEAFPKPNEGKYVAVFQELTDQWSARRNNTTQ